MSEQNERLFDARQERCSQILSELEHVDAFSMIDRANPWSPPSLNAVEKNMLDKWGSIDEIPIALKSKYEAFLGEGLRRRFGGVWVKLEPEMIGDTSGNAPSGLGIKYPESGTIDVVSSLLPLAFHAGTGVWWSSSFQVTEHFANKGEFG